MKLSTKGRYGTRLMVDLAIHHNHGPVLLKDIAARQEISEKYLWQLIPPLKNAGLIRSGRGAHSGYELTRPPEQVTLKDIILAVEGPLLLVQCVRNPNACQRMEACGTRGIWAEVSEKISRVLETVTLSGMAERQNNLSRSSFYEI